MQTSSFSGRFKVGTRIYTGFLLILALLVLVAGMGYQALKTVEAGFGTYASISDNSLRVSQIDGNVADMRRNVVNFVNNGDKKTADKVRDLQQSLAGALRDAVAATLDSERKANLEKMQKLLQGYTDNSNVDAVSEITALIVAQRAYEMNSKVISTADEMLSVSAQVKS